MENNFQLNSAAVSDRGLSEKRPQNEDSYLELRKNGIFAVADGVGGAQAGDVASQMAMEIVGEAFVNLDGGDPEEMMRIAIERANESIFQMSHELEQLSTMATTIVALHLEGNIATIGHVGDSRIYRLDENGSLFRETQDHSVVEEEVRAGRMTPEQAATHPSRNVISRALGAEDTVEVDMKTIMIGENTIFLLCSDGITRHISDEELRDFLRSDSSPETICEHLKNVCYERGAEDNLTAVVVKVGEAPAEIEEAETADYEQATIATARSAAAGSVNTAAIEPDETETQELNLQSIKPSDENRITIPADDSTEKSNIKVSDVNTSTPDIRDYHDENAGGNFAGKLLSSLLLLIIGAGLGIAGYYLWNQQNKQETPPPMPTEMTSPNIAFTTFEEGRRTVDENPTAYIEQNKDLTQETAEDHYLLGRAYLLSENYQQAKIHFTEARDRLALANKSNSKILESDIALGLALINAPFAQKEIKKYLSPNQTEANTNVNSQTKPEPLQ
jgi:serine/threonine protein phosphatase PrpC